MSHKNKLNLGLNLFMLLLFNTFNFILAKYETAVILSGFFICLFLHFKILTNGVSLAGGGGHNKKERHLSISVFCGCWSVPPISPGARTHSSVCWALSLSLSILVQPIPDWQNRTGASRAHIPTPEDRLTGCVAHPDIRPIRRRAGMTALSSWELCVKYALFIFNFVFWVSWDPDRLILTTDHFCSDWGGKWRH